MSKKGQAAMEFLMTYGWAILVVLIAIGALAYFGVLNPGRFLPSSCTIMPGISCEDFVVTGGTTTISMTLRNGIGDDLNYVNVSVTEPDGGATICGLSCTGQCTAGAGGSSTMPDGVLTTWSNTSCTGGGGLGTVGSKFRGDVKFDYIGPGGLVHSRTGSITTQVE